MAFNMPLTIIRAELKALVYLSPNNVNPLQGHRHVCLSKIASARRFKCCSKDDKRNIKILKSWGWTTKVRHVQ